MSADAKTLQSANIWSGARVTIDIEGPLVLVTAGFGYDVGTAHLTPGQARAMARHLSLLADKAEAEL